MAKLKQSNKKLTASLAGSQRALQMAHAQATELETALELARAEVESLKALTATLVKSMRSMTLAERVRYVFTGVIRMQPTEVTPRCVWVRRSYDSNDPTYHTACGQIHHDSPNDASSNFTVNCRCGRDIDLQCFDTPEEYAEWATREVRV